MLFAARWSVEVALLAACLFGLSRLAKLRGITLVTFASFGARLAVGVVLFVISLFRLPVLRSLQMPHGFWWFAPDASGYDVAARQFLGLADKTGFMPWEQTDPFIRTVAEMYSVMGVSAAPLLALNAALAAACVPLFGLAARHVGLSPRPALLVAALVGFWPSSFAWSGQMLKDPIHWLGLSAAICGVAVLIGRAERRDAGTYVTGGALLVGGQLITTTVRGYETAAFLLAAIAGLVAFVITQRAHLKAGLVSGGVLLAALAIGSLPARGSLIGVSQTVGSDLGSWSAALQRNVRADAMRWELALEGRVSPLWKRVTGRTLPLPAPAGTAASQTAGSRPTSGGPAGQPGAAAPVPALGVPAGAQAAPKPVAAQGPGAQCPAVRLLLVVRRGFDVTGGASLVDQNVQFNSCWDVVSYLPRALEISYVEPTPAAWLTGGHSTGPARYMAALDAALLWLLLPGIGAGLVKLLRKPNGASAMIAVYILLMGAALGLAVTNFGTLFRLRLDIIFPAVVLAVDGWVLLGHRLEEAGVPLAAWYRRPREASRSAPAAAEL